MSNRLSGLQAADRCGKLESQRGELAREIADLSESLLPCWVIDLARIENAIKNWRTGGGHTIVAAKENNLALTPDVAGGRFLR